MIEKFFQPKAVNNPNHDANAPQATFVEYLKSREFLLSLAIFLGGGLLILILTLTVLLPIITNHNEQTEVPDITGLPYRKAVDLLSNAGLEVEVSDSVFKPDLKPLTVDHQDPAALSIVKPGRTVFLRVNKVQPPMVKLPNIFEESLEHAKDILTNWKLKVGNITYVPSSFNNLVIGAFHHGKAINKDTPVPEGAKIDLKVSSWNVSQKVPLPDLVGKDFTDAMREITSLGLIPNPQFVLSASAERLFEVYKQDPRYKGKTDSITVGSQVTIFVNNDGPPRIGDGGSRLGEPSESSDEDSDSKPKRENKSDKADKKDDKDRSKERSSKTGEKNEKKPRKKE